MLLIRETHQVAGVHEEAFEALARDEWLPGIARGDCARLLYYLNLAHGSGESYRVVTYTLVRDAEAWGELAARVSGGDLRPLAERMDALRHDVEAKIYQPLPWSPAGEEIEIAEVPGEPTDHDPSLFMEDTVWPQAGKLEEYVRRAGDHYAVEFDQARTGRPQLLEIQAAYRTAHGGGRRHEVVLWQKVANPKGMVGLLTREIPPQYKAPGRWMHDALALRDQWHSRLLRTSRWSPLW